MAGVYQGYATQLDWEINWCQCNFLKLREQIRNSQYLLLVLILFSVRLSLSLAPEHDLVDSITSSEQAEAVADYKHQASLKSDLARTDLAKEKTGVGLVLMPSTLSMARKSQSGLRTMFLLVMEQVR